MHFPLRHTVPHRVPSLPARFRSLLVAGRIHVVLCTVRRCEPVFPYPCGAAPRCRRGLAWTGCALPMRPARVCQRGHVGSLCSPHLFFFLIECDASLLCWCFAVSMPPLLCRHHRGTCARMKWAPTCGPCVHAFLSFEGIWTRYVWRPARAFSAPLTAHAAALPLA